MWIGVLPQLWIILRAPDSGAQTAIARRFSQMALISVVALSGTGLAMALLYGQYTHAKTAGLRGGGPGTEDY